MTWNYRLVKKDDVVGIHEVYYLEEDVPWSCTESPVRLQWDEDEDSEWYAERLRRAFVKPVLNYEDIGNE